MVWTLRRWCSSTVWTQWGSTSFMPHRLSRTSSGMSRVSRDTNTSRNINAAINCDWLMYIFATESCLFRRMSNSYLSLCVFVFATSADALPGVLRWQSRLWQLVTKLRGVRNLGEFPNPSLLSKKELAESKKIWENMNYAIQEVENPWQSKDEWKCLRSDQEGPVNGPDSK